MNRWVGNSGRPSNIPLGTSTKSSSGVGSSSRKMQSGTRMSGMATLVEKSLNGGPAGETIEIRNYSESPQSLKNKGVEQPFLENSLSKSSLDDKSPLSGRRNQFTVIPMKAEIPVDVKLVRQQQKLVSNRIEFQIYLFI